VTKLKELIKSKKFWEIIIKVLLIIYLVVSANYIKNHITFEKSPLVAGQVVVGQGFSESENAIRVFMGLPKTYTTYDKVGPIYIISVAIRVLLALLIFASLLRKKMTKMDKSIIWHDRKRNFLGLPWSFTEYSLSEDRLFVAKGILNKVYNEVRLYRVIDVSLTKSFWQRLIGTGTVHLITSDLSLKNFDLINVADAESINEMISRMTNEERKRNRVIAREDMNVSDSEPTVDDNINDNPVNDSDDSNDNDGNDNND